MSVCTQCGARYLAAVREPPDALSRYAGTRCPVCVLRHAPPDRSVPNRVRSSARTALSFDATDDLRSRIRAAIPAEVDHHDHEDADARADAEPDGGSRALRRDDLRRLALALGASADDAAERTNRELRSRVADAVDADVDVSPASPFRKDALVEITLRVLERVPQAEE